MPPQMVWIGGSVLPLGYNSSMLKSGNLLAIWLAISLASAFIGVQAQSAPLRLSGGVTHSEVLPPLPADQTAGKIFKGLVANRKLSTRVSRFRVPPWLAGVWQRTDATEVSRVMLPGGRHVRPAGRNPAVVTDTFGTYQDAQGQIWQTFSPANAFGSIDRGAAIDYHAVLDYQLVTLGRNSVVVEVQARHAAVNKKTRRIISAFQDEELNTYTLVADGRLRTDSSVKVFNAAGKPQFLARSVSSETRVGPFKGAVADKAQAGRKFRTP